jgi:hypothetical protein
MDRIPPKGTNMDSFKALVDNKLSSNNNFISLNNKIF